MALAGIGKNYNPSTLNTWLKGHNGYVNGDKFVAGSISILGLTFTGKIANPSIANSLKAGNVIVLNVLNGAHWVLATSMIGNTIYVNDPLYSTLSYDLKEIVAGNSGLYMVTGESIIGEVIN